MTAGGIFNTDLGCYENFERVWKGPSLGWQFVPVTPQLVVTSTAPLVLSKFASRVLLKAACTSVTLPLCSQWMTENFQGVTAFDRSIWIKDLGLNASVGSPITITPAGSDQIDGLASFLIVTAGALIRLYPLTDQTAWYLG
jgi:hypothetical protein